MKESRKEFIKKAHESACSEWKTNIEKEFPKLFKKDALVVGKWYNDKGCLFNYQKSSNVYGFFTDGIWTNDPWSWGGKYSTLATDKEVEQALIKEAKKRGFKEGVNFKSNLMRGIGELFDGHFFFDNKFELCYRNHGGVLYTLFKNGIWAEIQETITREQAEKELGKTIIN